MELFLKTLFFSVIACQSYLIACTKKHHHTTHEAELSAARRPPPPRQTAAENSCLSRGEKTVHLQGFHSQDESMHQSARSYLQDNLYVGNRSEEDVVPKVIDNRMVNISFCSDRSGAISRVGRGSFPLNDNKNLGFAIQGVKDQNLVLDEGIARLLPKTPEPQDISMLLEEGKVSPQMFGMYLIDHDNWNHLIYHLVIASLPNSPGVVIMAITVTNYKDSQNPVRSIFQNSLWLAQPMPSPSEPISSMGEVANGFNRPIFLIVKDDVHQYGQITFTFDYYKDATSNYTTIIKAKVEDAHPSLKGKTFSGIAPKLNKTMFGSNWNIPIGDRIYHHVGLAGGINLETKTNANFVSTKQFDPYPGLYVSDKHQVLYGYQYIDQVPSAFNQPAQLMNVVSDHDIRGINRFAIHLDQPYDACGEGGEVVTMHLAAAGLTDNQLKAIETELSLISLKNLPNKTHIDLDLCYFEAENDVMIKRVSTKGKSGIVRYNLNHRDSVVKAHWDLRYLEREDGAISLLLPELEQAVTVTRTLNQKTLFKIKSFMKDERMLFAITELAIDNTPGHPKSILAEPNYAFVGTFESGNSISAPANCEVGEMIIGKVYQFDQLTITADYCYDKNRDLGFHDQGSTPEKVFRLVIEDKSPMLSATEQIPAIFDGEDALIEAGFENRPGHHGGNTAFKINVRDRTYFVFPDEAIFDIPGFVPRQHKPGLYVMRQNAIINGYLFENFPNPEKDRFNFFLDGISAFKKLSLP